MGLLKSLGRLLASPPFVVTMSIVAHGIRTTITRSNEPAHPADFLALKGLPEPVVQYLRAQTELGPGEYHLPFPAAKRLIKELQSPALANRVKLEVAAIAALRSASVPSDFRVRWHFDSKRHVLMRRLIQADGYLGGGCF